MAAVEASGSKPRKLGGYEFYREVLGSPKHIVAPMVDQSELAWRVLSRRYGSDLIYTPMINAKIFSQDPNPGHRDKQFDLTEHEEGDAALDRPLIVQFCANDAQQLLTAARVVQHRCDAVDLNLGCPQEIARKGHYGSFLMEDWTLIHTLVRTLHEGLDVPVTAKFRVFPDVEKTVAYARMLEDAGAQILTCHGRLREQRGHNTGLADWEKIRAVKEAVKVPVFANGNILYYSDIERALEATGADAIMSAEGQLYNAALFASATHAHRPAGALAEAFPSTGAFDAGLHPPHADLALEYLAIARGLRTHTAWSGVKGHLFKLLRPALAAHQDLRARLGQMRKDDYAAAEAICVEMKERMDRDILAAAGRTPAELVQYAPADDEDGPHAASRKTLPHWLAQPHWRANSSAKAKVDASAKAAAAAAANTAELKGAAGTNGTVLSDATNGTTTTDTAMDGKVEKSGVSVEPSPATGENKVMSTPASVTATEVLVQDAFVAAGDARKPEEQDGIFHERLATSALAVDAGDVAVIADSAAGGEKRTRADRTPEPDPAVKRAKIEAPPT